MMLKDASLFDFFCRLVVYGHLPSTCFRGFRVLFAAHIFDAVLGQMRDFFIKIESLFGAKMFIEGYIVVKISS